MVTADRSRRRSLTGRFSYRLVAAMVLVSLPLLIVLAVLLTTQASSSLNAAGANAGVGLARSVPLRLEDWLAERRRPRRPLAGNLETTAANGGR